MKLDSKERGKPNEKGKANASPKTRGKPSVAQLVKGYMGFLVGTGKSTSTISSYKGDLDLFEKFLRERNRDFYRLQPRDLESYQVWLEKAGLKTNTRRRKVLSAKALVKFAVTRKKLPAGHAVQYVKTPERLDRLPWILTPAEYARVLEAVDTKTQTGLRNYLVVSLLAETGLTLAELCRLRWDSVAEGILTVAATSGATRHLAIPPATALRLEEWRGKSSGKHLFPGFNRHGITSEKMTPRGVELYFRVLARASGLRLLKPKTLRHYCIVEWLRAGVGEAEIQKRLGVHPNYSLAAYRKVLEREVAV